MKKSILFFAAIAALLSCSKENPATDNLPAETHVISFEAYAPDASDAEETKTTLVDNSLVHWSKEDKVKVLFFPRTNDTQYVESGETTGRSGVFTASFEDETSSRAFFKCDWSWDSEEGIEYFNEGIALYPSTVTATSYKQSGGQYMQLVNDINYDLPSEQIAVENSFQNGINFSYARISDKYAFNNNKASLSFNNACALIKITIPAVDDVVSVKVESSGGYLSGTYEVSSYENSYYKLYPVYPLSLSVKEGNSSVTLTAPDGETLKAGSSYYIVVWPGTHSGLTFTFVNKDGNVAVKPFNKTITFTAAKYKSFTVNSGLDFTAPVVEHDYYYSDGKTGNDATRSDIVGVIFYHGNPREKDTALPEHCTNGLAISLKTTATPWNSSILPNSDFSNDGLGTNNTGGVWGYYAKEKWQSYNLTLYNTDYGTLPVATSGWYHGTKNEWDMIAASVSELNDKMSECKGESIAPVTNSFYWLPFAMIYANGNMYVSTFYLSNGVAKYSTSSYYNYSYYARPIFAF